MIVAGQRLEIGQWGGEDALAPIVLLHEGLGSVAAWRDFPAQLAARTRRRVVAYSRKGYGASERLERAREPDYMHVEADVVLPELLDALGLSRPVLFGHSDGASIALLFASAYPHRASALILEAPHLFVEEITVTSIARAKDLYTTTDFRARLSRYHDDVDGAFRGWNDIWLDPRFRSWNITAGLERIRIPVLALQGRDDEYGTADQLEALAALVPSVTAVLLDRCGHAPHRDRVAEVLERSAAFLAGAPAVRSH